MLKVRLVRPNYLEELLSQYILAKENFVELNKMTVIKSSLSLDLYLSS